MCTSHLCTFPNNNQTCRPPRFQCNQLGSNLKDVVDKYKKYDECSAGLLTWLHGSEDEARRQQSEAIGADPQTLHTQLEDTKASEARLSLALGFIECFCHGGVDKRPAELL